MWQLVAALGCGYFCICFEQIEYHSNRANNCSMCRCAMRACAQAGSVRLFVCLLVCLVRLVYVLHVHSAEFNKSLHM